MPSTEDRINKAAGEVKKIQKSLDELSLSHEQLKVQFTEKYNYLASRYNTLVEINKWFLDRLLKEPNELTNQEK